MTAPPIDNSPIPPSYRDVLITHAERPRSIRPNVRALWSLLVLLIAAAWAAAIVKSLFVKWFASPSVAGFITAEWYVLIGLLILIFVELSGLRSARRDCELMKNGEVAIASVLSQKNIYAPRSSISRLTYTFEDTRGIKYQGSCRDATGKLFKGMTFLVFFERDLPMTQLASCNSSFEIVLPDER